MVLQAHEDPWQGRSLGMGKAAGWNPVVGSILGLTD